MNENQLRRILFAHLVQRIFVLLACLWSAFALIVPNEIKMYGYTAFLCALVSVIAFVVEISCVNYSQKD